MEKIKILEAYRRYCDKLNTNSPIFEDFKRTFTYLFYNVEENLSEILFTDCVVKTLKAVTQRQLSFKVSNSAWSKERVDTFYKSLDSTVRAYKRQDNEAFAICFYKLFKCIIDEELPNLQLYMFSKYKETEFGEKYLCNSSGIVKELLKCESEEAIAACLKEFEKREERKTIPNSKRKFSNYSVPKVELFELFNPKDLEETKECYAKLEEMADNCTISEEDYFYVKDILLSPRLTFYKRGGVYKEPSNSSNKLELEVIDGSSFEEEMEECLGDSK